MPYFIHDYHRLHYRECGQGPLLLVLPGNTASSACHDGEIAHYSKRYHVVCLDFLGTGRSDRVPLWPDDWWAWGAYDAAALARHLGEERCLVLGTSGGAIAALWLGILYPQMVSAIVADSTVEYFPPASIEAGLSDRAQCRPDQRAFWRHAHGDDWRQVVAADCLLLRRLAGRGGDWLHGRLNEIRCPVLLTASRADAMLPDVERQFAHMRAQIADSEVFLTNEGNHPLMWSQPDAFRAVADPFLQRHAALSWPQSASEGNLQWAIGL